MEEVSAAWTTGGVFANANRNKIQVSKYAGLVLRVSKFQKYIYETNLIDLMRKAFVTYLLIASAFSLSAQSLSLPDQSSNQYDTHLVVKGETLYSLSKKYQTTVDLLLRLNPDIINNNLETGSMIRVPFVEDAAIPDEKLSSHDRAVMHKVEKGETVYSLSKKFNTDVTTILMWNELKEPLIQEGQMLVVGYETPQSKAMGPFPMKDSRMERSDEKKEIDKNEKLRSEKTDSGKGNQLLHDEKGIALWTHSTYDDGNFYALHATAPQGTEIVVKNLMNERTVVVKVVGHLPSTSENDNILIKLSESAAKKLNVRDEKFLVELSYSLPEEITRVDPN